MLSILHSPFPVDDDLNKKVLVSIMVGIFVALFLYLFQPFGINEKEEATIYKYIGFGIVSFIGVFLVEVIVPKLYTSFYEERNYTVLKEILVGVLTIAVVAIGNIIYLNTFLEKGLNAFGCMIMIWQTFLVGLFPISLLTYIKYVRLLKSNLSVSSAITIGPADTDHKALNTMVTPSLVIQTESENNEINLANLLYIESVGNYINVATTLDGQPARNLYRKTLKSVESSSTHDNIRRCHRSYIVNLDKVTEVKGNAQGLKLTLKDCQDLIPVSRKYIKEVKQYFDKASSPN